MKIKRIYENQCHLFCARNTALPPILHDDLIYSPSFYVYRTPQIAINRFSFICLHRVPMQIYRQNPYCFHFSIVLDTIHFGLLD